MKSQTSLSSPDPKVLQINRFLSPQVLAKVSDLEREFSKFKKKRLKGLLDTSLHSLENCCLFQGCLMGRQKSGWGILFNKKTGVYLEGKFFKNQLNGYGIQLNGDSYYAGYFREG